MGKGETHVDIAFSLVTMKPGHTVVNNVRIGPEMLKKVCWKVRSVNGVAVAEIPMLQREDIVVIENSRWAVDRASRNEYEEGICRHRPRDLLHASQQMLANGTGDAS